MGERESWVIICLIKTFRHNVPINIFININVYNMLWFIDSDQSSCRQYTAFKVSLAISVSQTITCLCNTCFIAASCSTWTLCNQQPIYVEANLMFQVIICQPHAEKNMQWRAMQECGRIKRKNGDGEMFISQLIKSCDIWRFHYLPYIMSWWFTLRHSSFCFYWRISQLFGKPNTIQYQIQLISDCSVPF